MSLSVGQPNWVDENGATPRHGNIIYFFDKPEKSERDSLKEGRPVFHNRTYIHKSTPGDNLLTIERPLRDQDRLDFPREWQVYSEKKSVVMDGTPLAEWPIMDRLRVAELNAVNIFTVEQIVNLPGAHESKIMGYNELKKKALAYLNHSKLLASAEQIEAERNEMKEASDAKDAEIRELKMRVEILEKLAQERIVSTGNPRKPGRPRKVNVADTASTSSADC